ncbi:MAG: Hsp20/alpha crystallin family protein [Candidatus Calescibacterium sp.]|nr:Hsp20/alpha crystallin family protein [Candidatus Calescibacterium sp.]MDW8195711.1 Hsp20/alpha crystallin family protein [Candidatus Calescibacterium sp.]
MSIDKEKPFLELSKIKDITSEILDVVFVKNYGIKKEYKVDTDVFYINQNGKEYYIVILSLPGLKKDSIEISLSEDTIVVSAKRELFFPVNMIDIQNEGDMLKFITEHAVYIENYYGNIYRKIRLPRRVKKIDQEAVYLKGLLYIKLECE